MSTTHKRYTRFELMDTTGRVVVHCGNTQSLEQDECRTLKVFIDEPARAAGLTVDEAYEAACKAYNSYSADEAPLTWGQYLRACLNEKFNTEAPPPPAAGLTVDEAEECLVEHLAQYGPDWSAPARNRLRARLTAVINKKQKP